VKQRIRNILLEVEESQMIYHGTSVASAQKMQESGFITPRGNLKSNYEASFMGGNPSNPKLVYCTSSKETAEDHARNAARKSRESGNGAIVEVVPEWDAVHLDEDDVFYLMLEGGTEDQELLTYLWTIYLWQNVDDPEYPDEIDEDFISQQSDLLEELESDSALSERMIDVSDEISSSKALQIIRQEGFMRFGFSRPLKITNVEYVK
jgi:hypothetical protein